MGGQKSLTTCSDVYMAVYTCAFCLKNYTEDLLERCDHCGEIFCKKCVLFPILRDCALYSLFYHYFCSYDCNREFQPCEAPRCRLNHTATTLAAPCRLRRHTPANQTSYILCPSIVIDIKY